MEKSIKVPLSGILEPTTLEGIVATSDTIKDSIQNKKLSEVNAEIINNLHTISNKVDNKADSNIVPTKTSELVNDSNFLTLHLSLVGYAKETWVTQKIADAQLSGGEVDLTPITNKLDNINNITTQQIDTAVNGVIPNTPNTKPNNFYNKEQTDARIAEEIGKIEVTPGGGMNLNGYTVWIGDEIQYKNIPEKDSMTIYYVKEV